MTYEDALDIVQRYEHVPFEEAEEWLVQARAVVLEHRLEQVSSELKCLGAEISRLREEEAARVAAAELAAAQYAAGLRRKRAATARRARRERYSVPVREKLLLQSVPGDSQHLELIQYETGAFCVRVPAALLVTGLRVCVNLASTAAMRIRGS